MTPKTRTLGLRAMITVAAVCLAACGDDGNSRDASDRDGGADQNRTDLGADIPSDQGRDTLPDTPVDQRPDGDGGGDSATADVAGGDTDVGNDANHDAGAGDGGGLDAGGGNDGARPTLDTCFAGLPAPVGFQMIADKSSADGRVRVRVALDTMGSYGTAGSYAWHLIRFGVEVDGDVRCVTNAGQLTYTGSHHNCSDSAVATDATTRFELQAPDRPTMLLTIRDGGVVRLGPITLTDTSCQMADSVRPLPRCITGGPC